MMATQEGPKRTKLAAQPDEETRVALEKAQAEAEAALARARDEEQARLKAEKALAKDRKALAAARAKLEQERQAWAKIEQARAEAENTEVPPSALGKEGAERRITFIVRLTVDERGQPRRTEIEHAHSGKKETFPGLDVQRLAAFMKACVSPPDHPSTDDPPSASPYDSRSPNE